MADNNKQRFSVLAPLRPALAAFGERLGVNVNDANPVHLQSNLVVELPSARLVVRVAGARSLAAVSSSMEVTGWLSSRGFPCVEPVGIPFRWEDNVLSAWRLLDLDKDRPPSGSELGQILRQLHNQALPPFELRRLTDPLSDVAAAVNSPTGTAEADRRWLSDRIGQLRKVWVDLVSAQEPGLIHGDAHPGNLFRLRRGGGLVLGDWDGVSVGPREWDLIQIHYFARRFKRYDESDLKQFTQAYGWDVRDLEGFDYLVLLREFYSLSSYIRRAATEQWARDEVAYRVRTLREEDATAAWYSPQRQPWQ
uniref:phosphotransferase enzyme family protein n=1 Tax=Actinomadura sp. CA-154981 TaxID=3240037 RepID=UPI003F491B8D